MYKKLIPLLSCLLLAFLTAGYSLSGEDKEKKPFRDLIVTTSETHLILFGVVNSTFTDEMISAAKSGLPIRFNFQVELYLDQVDEPVVLLDFAHTLTYDTLKESYEILLEEANAKTQQARTLDEAKMVMNEINGLKLLQLEKLVPGSRYRLRIRGHLFEKTLPMGIHKVLPFISPWDNETDWQVLEFNY
ncbi:DUF4390 domain-containing protein [Desulfopila sp. IMCC35008]|uniref:DUF4390 domain-containing protein n=1 Tax=Desulfopila sp. IMCC35008 TaxID=2653858 RepID=UPI0013D79999|nr:DUF4390 domain-containing protein [Desulfopila sp. IMCC35008]